jgi:hypothetical protein
MDALHDAPKTPKNRIGFDGADVINNDGLGWIEAIVGTNLGHKLKRRCIQIGLHFLHF